jgi:hypothetical protein
MRVTFIGIIRFVFVGMLFSLAFSAPARARRETQEIKVRVEASAWYQTLLLEKLNDSGRLHGLHFDEADQNFDYRIAFGTGHDPVAAEYGQMNDTSGSAAVFDAHGAEMFEFNREGRFSDAGVTNAIAKEIVKRLLKIRAELPPS